jgi:ASC-1-like (ASCH) protein
MVHIAIMNPKWKLIPLILNGSKTIESRFYINRIAPWNRIRRGETIYFKDSGKPVTAKATVSKVLQYDKLENNKALQLEIFEKYGKLIWPENIAFEDWYEKRKNKRYGILIFLEDPIEIKPFNIDKTGFGNACAWLAMKELKLLN